MAKRKGKRWTNVKIKKPINTPPEELAKLRARRRKPDGIYYDDIHVKKEKR